MVAPPVGAWIEMLESGGHATDPKSLPPWERGLKSCTINKRLLRDTSLPPWERGLKFAPLRYLHRQRLSLPPWAGISLLTTESSVSQDVL